MYVKGISTRRVTGVLEKMCGLKINSTQVSRAGQILNEELDNWRNRPLGEYTYLFLDASYEKVRIGSSVRSCAVFTAIEVNTDGKHEILGVSVSLDEAEPHWRDFLKSLLIRGLHGVKFVASDAHSGLKAARQALFNGVRWQRYQYHLQKNAQAYVPKKQCKTRCILTLLTSLTPSGELALDRLKCYVEKLVTLLLG